MNRQPKSHSLLQVYFWTLAFLKPYIWKLLLLILCGLIITGAQLVIPKLIQYFIDIVLNEQQSSAFMWLISFVVILVVFIITFSAIRNIIQRFLQEKASRDMQFSIYTHLRKLGFAYFEKHPVGESLALMNTEVASLQNLYRHLLPWMINNFIFSIISITLMVTISWRLSLILIPSLLLYYIFGPYLEKKASKYGKMMADDRIRFNQKVYESIASLNDVRANSAEVWDLSNVRSRHKQLNKMMIKTYWFAFWRGTNRRMSYFIGGVAIIIFGSHLSLTGQLSTGAFVAFLLYYFQTMHILTSVVTSITEQRVLMDQAEKLYEFMRIPAVVQEEKDTINIDKLQGYIELQDVSFNYPDSPEVLNQFRLSICAGEKVALVGASGNGKSTILKLIGRFYDPSKGSILLDGQPIQKLSFKDVRGNLGFVFQETYLFGASVRDNILFGKPDASEAEVVDAAKAAFAHDFITELPLGYDTLLGERGVKLSGGQKQRISIARMFIKNPPIILLDEATASLDTISEKEVQAALQKLMEGRTTVTVAHRLSTIKNYDNIVLIENGKVLESGSYEELVKRRGAFYHLSRGQKLEGA
ncbi:ABC transporter ATP-binding protein [Gracilibacillus kekensis]|uniref:ATP-binding cassette, subfamily B/ATP-binding cassette, subfamily B, MsbA n=1 Tax=Gracilibacillus kekensis TaxID=1027249 RepID=A0A1M7IU09_9BACI|nr:ABC transporter ATP-binding protein [Gracilibacillus kekensis]SHM44103.1 ATP-binding cassette, subfamily B/ATP-binding cassette, subfamily B, MsbA [Gracilibacillus kekensis]